MKVVLGTTQWSQVDRYFTRKRERKFWRKPDDRTGKALNRRGHLSLPDAKLLESVFTSQTFLRAFLTAIGIFRLLEVLMTNVHKIRENFLFSPTSKRTPRVKVATGATVLLSMLLWATPIAATPLGTGMDYLEEPSCDTILTTLHHAPQQLLDLFTPPTSPTYQEPSPHHYCLPPSASVQASRSCSSRLAVPSHL